MFFWQLALEKTIKAVISNQGRTSPVVHNLNYLCQYAKIKVDKEIELKLKEISSFNLEARYDDYKFTFYKKGEQRIFNKMGEYLSGDTFMVKKKYLKKSVINQVSRFNNQLAKAGFKIKNLIIFGSQVKGTAKRWSDIDVCVVSTNFGKDRHTERVKLMSLTDNYDWRIEPHPYHPRDLADKWDPLAHEIRKYGISWQEVAP